MYHVIVALLLAPSMTMSLEIACGWDHTCVFERGHPAMTCWGRNSERQLGLDDNKHRGNGEGEMGSNLPLINLGSGFIVQEMSLGYLHSCAISDQGAMKCFGNNGDSQLGFYGSTATGDALPFLDFGANTYLSKVVTGGYHTCALSTEDVLKCFGLNNLGQCGTGNTVNPISSPPSQISAIDFGTNFTPIYVDTFAFHACVFSQQRTIKCFGRNQAGQLGYGDTNKRGETADSMGDGLPIVDLGPGFVPTTMTTGSDHTCALSTNKTVKCWGSNEYGQCGTPHSTETGDNLPVLDLGADFVPMQLALGGTYTCILSENRTLKCFGGNQYGQLGIGNANNVVEPNTLTGVDLGTDFVPRLIATGFHHACAVSTNDAVKCWGWNSYGQLGLGHTDSMGDDPNEMGDNLPFVDIAWQNYTTVAPTNEPTALPSTGSPTTRSPTTASPTTTSPSTPTPTTWSPTSTQPTTTPTSGPSVEPTTRGPSKSLSTIISILDPPTALPAKVPTAQPSAITNITKAPSSSSNWISNSLNWLELVALCIGSVCFCGAVFAAIKCIAGKRRSRHANVDDDQHAAQVEIPNRPLPVVPNPISDKLNSESDSEEKKDDIEPGAGEPDLSFEDSFSNKSEGLRASIAAKTATAGLAPEELDGLAEDEFEVVGDEFALTSGRARE